METLMGYLLFTLVIAGYVSLAFGFYQGSTWRHGPLIMSLGVWLGAFALLYTEVSPRTVAMSLAQTAAQIAIATWRPQSNL